MKKSRLSVFPEQIERVYFHLLALLIFQITKNINIYFNKQSFILSVRVRSETASGEQYSCCSS